jgi:hypothetical protein
VSNTLEPWEKRKPGQTDVQLTDNPTANVNLPKRVHLIEIVLESAPKCPCKNKRLIATATQTIDGGGSLKTQD